MENRIKTPENNPFKVPENYFDEVSNKIILSTTGRKGGTVFYYNRFRVLIAAAAAIILLLTAGYLTIRLVSNDRYDLEMAESYLPEDDVLFNELDIFTIEENSTITELPSEVPEMSSDEIIDYLIGEDIDITLIYEKI